MWLQTSLAAALVACVLVAGSMVGFFLGRPKNCQTGILVMRKARDTLLALGSLGKVVVTNDDASCIRMKATWQGSRFTLTLTGNTGYVFLQGPAASLLAFGSHVAGAIGGKLHVAKDVGAEPRNPSEQAGCDPGVTVTEPVAEEPQGFDSEQQHTGTQPAAADSATDGANSNSAVLSGQGNVIISGSVITLNDNTDAPAGIDSLVDRLRNVLRVSTRRDGA